VSWLSRAASLTIPFLAFVLVLRLPLPRSVLLASYYYVASIAIAAGIVLWYCHVRRDWLGTIAGLTVTLGLFALPLAALWQQAAMQYSAIGGLLPWSDASGYYYDARRLLDGYPLDWSARRPLYVGLLSTLLALTRQNLQVVLAVFVAVNAVATFLLARELRISHGPVEATVATIVLFFFYRIEGGTGTTLTENLGFAMGVVAFAVLWRGFGKADARSISIGLGLLTIALMARAGAFFVLPALVVVAVCTVKARWRWLRLGLASVGSVTITAGLALLVGRLLSNPAGEQTPFSNFSNSLYGLVVGGKGWTQVLQDHPGAREGAQIYSLALQAFRAHPMGLVEGSLKMWGAYLLPSEPYHAFAFVRGADPFAQFFPIACYVLSGIGLGVAVRGHRQPSYALLIAATIGHLSSIPLVPPTDAGLRVYAATIPILAILPSLGVGALLRWAGIVMRVGRLAGSAAKVPDEAPASPTGEVFGIVLAAVVFVGPVCLFYTSRPPPIDNVATCPQTTVPVHVRLSSGSFLRIIKDVENGGNTRVTVPHIRERDLRNTTQLTELKDHMDRVSAGHTMLNGYDLKTGRIVWLIAPSDLLPPPPRLLEICGHRSPDALPRQYGFFYADTVQAAPN
jgi:hypothetical protein